MHCLIWCFLSNCEVGTHFKTNVLDAAILGEEVG